MSIPLTCPNGHFLKVKNTWAGKKGLCPHCGAIINVPPLSAGSASVMGRSGSSVITEIPGRRPVGAGIAANEETIEKTAADTSPLVARQRSTETKPVETKPAEPKPVGTKPAEPKSADSAAGSKSGVMRLVTAKSLETRPVVARPIQPTHSSDDDDSLDSSKSVLDADSVDGDGSSIFNDLAPKKGSTSSQSRMIPKPAMIQPSGIVKTVPGSQSGSVKTVPGSQSAVIKPPTKVAMASPSTGSASATQSAINARKFCPACKVNVLTLTGVCPRCQLKIPVIPELHRVH